MIKVLARSELKPGSWEKATPLFRELLEKTRGEKGCVEYRLFINQDNPDGCVVVETWESLEDQQKHTQSEHFRRIIPQIGELRIGPGEVTFWEEFH